MGDSDFFFPDEFPYDCASLVCSLDSDEDDKEDPATKVDPGCSPQSTLCSHSDWEAQRLLQVAQMAKQEKMERRQALVRALFLQPPTSSTTRESTGTGVFLPRVITVAPTEPARKKTVAAAAACPTVLLPARVVQALNLNLNEIEARPTVSGGFILDKDAMRARTRQMQRTAMKQGREHEVVSPQPGPTDLHRHQTSGGGGGGVINPAGRQAGRHVKYINNAYQC